MRRGLRALLPAPAPVVVAEPPAPAPVSVEEESTERIAPVVVPAAYGRPQHGEERRIDGLTRDQICERFRKRVVIIARRVSERLPSDCELDAEDLASFGAIGLLEAFDRFDPTRNILFSTFAEYRIRGAMMDALRQGDSFTRYRRQIARRIQAATAELTSELGVTPGAEQVAARLGMDIEEYWHVMDRTVPVSFVSIYESTEDNGDDRGRPLADMLAGSDGAELQQRILGVQARDKLRQAILGLTEKKRQCVILYYGRGLSLAEIAAVFELTPARICQILATARAELKVALEGVISPEDLLSPEALRLEAP